MQNDNRTTPTDSDVKARRPRTRDSLRPGLVLIPLLTMWVASLTGPVMFDLALIATSLLLIGHWWRQRRWTLTAVTAIVPPTIAVLCVPGILADAGLRTTEVKVELIWSSFIIGLMIALVACGFIAALLRRRFVVVSVVAVALCAASVAMHCYSVKYYHLNEIDFSWQIPGAARLRIESLRGVGRIYVHWKGSAAKPTLNFFRTSETDVFGQGGRVRGMRAFLTYIHSTRNERDHIFGPALILQLSYWMLAVASGMLVIPWACLLRRARTTETPAERP